MSARPTLYFTVEGLPQPKERPRFATKDRRGKPLRKPRVFTPSRTGAYEKLVGLEAIAAMKRSGVREFTGSVSLEAWVYADSQRDGDNVLKAIADGLQGVAFGNDSQVLDWTVHVRPLELRDCSKCARVDVTVAATGLPLWFKPARKRARKAAARVR